MRSAWRLLEGRERLEPYLGLEGWRDDTYLWNMIHCETDTMLSCVSLRVDNLALRASSENAIAVLSACLSTSADSRRSAQPGAARSGYALTPWRLVMPK